MVDVTIDKDMESLRAVAQANERRKPKALTLEHHLMKYREDASHPILTTTCVQLGGWYRYFMEYLGIMLIQTLIFATVTGGYLLLVSRGSVTSSFTSFTASIPASMAGTLLVTSHLFTGRRYLRPRGWVIMSLPVIAALVVLYVVFF